MNNFLVTFPAILTLLLLTACGDGGYRTDFAPPSGSEKYADLFPADVGGVPAKIEPLALDAALFKGAGAIYGANARVFILQTRDSTALDAYVKNTAVPELAKYNNRSSGKINGVWKFRGHGSMGRTYGWQNGAWLFAVEASNDALFDETVAKFHYISKK